MSIELWKGDWALVTGASSGIGREFCLQLAAAGMNVAMVARRRPLLEQLTAEVRARHDIQTLVIEQDLGERHAAAAVKARTASEGVIIRLLVNNAGAGPWGRIERNSPETCEALIQLLFATPVAMCLHYINDLGSFTRSAIINLSSPAALQPVPYMAVYSAAKASLHNFSLALYGEWQKKGVHVQTLIPGPTQTEFDRNAGAYRSALGEHRGPASTVVRASLANVEKDLPVVTTAAGVYKQRVFAGLFPTKLIVRKVGQMFSPPQQE